MRYWTVTKYYKKAEKNLRLWNIIIGDFCSYGCVLFGFNWQCGVTTDQNRWNDLVYRFRRKNRFSLMTFLDLIIENIHGSWDDFVYLLFYRTVMLLEIPSAMLTPYADLIFRLLWKYECENKKSREKLFTSSSRQFFCPVAMPVVLISVKCPLGASGIYLRFWENNHLHKVKKHYLITYI